MSREVSPGAARPRRLPPDERRAQIVAAVLEVVSKFGVPGATVSRIAATAGVSEGALYVHFGSRDDMLASLIESSAGKTAVERLTHIAENHSRMMKTELDRFANPWIEFVAAGPQVGIREAVAKTQSKAFAMMHEIVRRGQDEGCIRKDLDSRRLTWQFYTILWAENVSSMMGLSEYIDDGHSAYSLDLLLREAAT
jgi:AcrR family transcriptional regulator